MDRVVQLGQAALAAPFAGFGDFEAYPDTAHKAGIYCSRIIRYHPLLDGNKRTGYDVMREFLERNGYEFVHPVDLLDTAKVIDELAASRITEAQFCAWVSGIGAALTRTAIEWLRDSGMSVAMVETGGDPDHLPARRTYESTGFTPLAGCAS